MSVTKTITSYLRTLRTLLQGVDYTFVKDSSIGSKEDISIDFVTSDSRKVFAGGG